MRFTFLHFLLDVKFLTLTCNKRCVFLSFDKMIILMRLLCLHKESCNVLSSINFPQFNNIRQQTLN